MRSIDISGNYDDETRLDAEWSEQPLKNWSRHN
jgi:hypothetical protein